LHALEPPYALAETQKQRAMCPATIAGEANGRD
jgi:hypothetical protein